VAAELYDTAMPIVTVSEADYQRIEDGVDLSISMDGNDAILSIDI
jgi:hypothetical protein